MPPINRRKRPIRVRYSPAGTHHAQSSAYLDTAISNMVYVFGSVPEVTGAAITGLNETPLAEITIADRDRRTVTVAIHHDVAAEIRRWFEAGAKYSSHDPGEGWRLTI